MAHSSQGEWSRAAEHKAHSGGPTFHPTRAPAGMCLLCHLIRGKTLLPVPTCRSRFSGQGLWARHGPPTAALSSFSIQRPANPLASKRKDRRQKCRFKGDVPLLKIPGIREGGTETALIWGWCRLLIISKINLCFKRNTDCLYGFSQPAKELFWHHSEQHLKIFELKSEN